MSPRLWIGRDPRSHGGLSDAHCWKSFIEYFRHDQDWGDGGMTEASAATVSVESPGGIYEGVCPDAIARVVKPTDNSEAEENLN